MCSILQAAVSNFHLINFKTYHSRGRHSFWVVLIIRWPRWGIPLLNWLQAWVILSQKQEQQVLASFFQLYMQPYENMWCSQWNFELFGMMFPSSLLLAIDREFRVRPIFQVKAWPNHPYPIPSLSVPAPHLDPPFASTHHVSWSQPIYGHIATWTYQLIMHCLFLTQQTEIARQP